MKKLLVVGIVGVAAGAAASHFVTVKMLTRSIEERVSKEYQDAIENLSSSMVERADVVLRDEATEGEDESISEEEEPTAVTQPDADPPRFRYDQQFSKPIYDDHKPDIEDIINGTYVKETPEFPEDEYVEEAVVEAIQGRGTEEISRVPVTVPYMITLEDYNDLDPGEGYSVMEISFYTDDEIAVDDSDDSILDSVELDRVIGRNLLANMITDTSTGDNVFFVRNEGMNMDIIVSIHMTSYLES